MSEKSKNDTSSWDSIDWAKEEMRNWRSWGSWFSWGSPVGLGLFFVLISFCLLILHWAGWLWVK